MRTAKARLAEAEGECAFFEQGHQIEYAAGMNTKRTRKAPLPGSFSEIFLARLDKIERDAKAVGANMTILCKKARISRAGPVRWRTRVPHTIALLDKLSAVVEKIAQQNAAKKK